MRASRPTAGLLRDFAGAVAGLGGARAVVGVHVRHGDKIVEATRLGWREYQKAAEAAVEAMSSGAVAAAAAAEGGEPAVVFLSTDSDEVRAAAAAATSGGGWRAAGGRVALRLVSLDGEADLRGAANDVQLPHTHELRDVSAYTREAVRETLPLPCVPTAFMAKTLSLPCIPTALGAKALHLPCVS